MIPISANVTLIKLYSQERSSTYFFDENSADDLTLELLLSNRLIQNLLLQLLKTRIIFAKLILYYIVLSNYFYNSVLI